LKNFDIVIDPNEPMDYNILPQFALLELMITGDKKAREVYLRRFPDDKIDTVSSKASAPSPIIEWIEE